MDERCKPSRAVIATLLIAMVAVGCEDSGGARPEAPPDGVEPGTVVPGEGIPDPPDRLGIERGIVYSTKDGVQLLLDVYVPEGPGPHPAVVLIHGGGWRSGSRIVWDRPQGSIARGFVSEGFSVFAIDYRLAPPGGSWTAPAAALDVRDAVEWVRENGFRYGADGDRMILVGGSAGAHLAMLVGVVAEEEDIDVVVSWSGPSDLEGLADYPVPNRLVTFFVGCTYTECPDQWEQMSPVHFVDPSDPPMLIANSTQERIPLDQATRMASRLNDAGVDVELLVLEGTRHAQVYAPDVWDESVEFILEHV